MDETTRLRMRRAHTKHAWWCSCGAVVHGNGGRAQHKAMHQRRGDGHRGILQDEWVRLFACGRCDHRRHAGKACDMYIAAEQRDCGCTSYIERPVRAFVAALERAAARPLEPSEMRHGICVVCACPGALWGDVCSICWVHADVRWDRVCRRWSAKRVNGTSAAIVLGDEQS